MRAPAVSLAEGLVKNGLLVAGFGAMGLVPHPYDITVAFVSGIAYSMAFDWWVDLYRNGWRFR